MLQLQDVEVEAIYKELHEVSDEPSVFVVILYKNLPVMEGDFFKRSGENRLISVPFVLELDISTANIINPEVYYEMKSNKAIERKITNTINDAFVNRKGN
ncbi:hypothetical protein ACFQO8_03875 [Exiguobacterium aestuarii]|uniref:Uncharacterized protein n=1 Tax=Exiguobacterium aestuarii TaxID=273527 RepID=A0ABW2PMK7_9BACL|nr:MULTISPECIES: hypothetical protein [Exiguobacterium]MCT4787454.1 hypothetical protein [Exiguobacterium aestuarii]